MADFVQTLITTIEVGSLYGLIALGYTMVYGILQFINFAHSDIFVLGAWVSYTIAVTLGYAVSAGSPPIYAGILILLTAMATCGAVGFTIERLAYRPLRKAPRLNVLITAIGVSLFLENAGQLNAIFGTQPQRLPPLLPDATLFTFVGVDVHLVDVLVIVLAVALMLVLDWLVFRTKLGMAMRAVSFDTRVASLMGVNVDAVISFTFVLGSMLAAAAGFLYANKYPGLNQPAHATWILLGLKAFVAAVVGGIGNVRGATVGGYLIAFIEQFGVYVGQQLGWDNASAYTDVYVFVLLIVVLLVKPTGIFGSTVREKV